MEFSFTMEIKNVFIVKPTSHTMIPIRTTVMGEDLAWDFHLYVDRFMSSESTYMCAVKLESKVNPMKTISYTLECGVPEPNKLYLPEERITLSLRQMCSVGLKIQLGSGKALQQNVTVRRLYNDQSTGDVELHCGTLVIKAHKAVLGLHSETLRVAFGNMGCVEGQTGVYTIEEQHMKPEILQDVLKWMYWHHIENPLAKMADLLEAAEYFQINGLKETCGYLVVDRVTVENCLQVNIMTKC
jgi:hypothetical protein